MAMRHGLVEKLTTTDQTRPLQDVLLRHLVDILVGLMLHFPTTDGSCISVTWLDNFDNPSVETLRSSGSCNLFGIDCPPLCREALVFRLADH